MIMKNIKSIIVVLLLLASPAASMAQSAESSYFLDGMLFNNKLNPAMKAERGYMSLLVGNMSVQTKGNVGISDFLYPRGDKLATFMSGSVTADEFLKGMPKLATIGFNLDESIFSAGFRMFGGYFSLGVSLHSSMSLSIPKGFFEFAKLGLQNDKYSFTGLNIHTMNYAAATIGYSHRIYKGLRLGVNLKYLMGLAHADLTVDKLNVELSGERWMVESHAAVQAAMFCKANATVDENSVINGIEFGQFVPSAHGLGLDLGLVFDMDSIVPGLTLSASVVDLGYIKWPHMMHGQSTDAKVEFTGFNELDYNDMESSLQKEFEQLGEDAAELIDFNYDGIKATRTPLNTKMYVGAEYNMPFYKPLSVGVLYSQCFSSFDCNKWYNVRGYLNISPLKWLEASVNYGYGTYGTCLGWMFNFHPKGFSFFVGSDYMITKVTPQYIPVDNLNAHVIFGINFPMGKRK